MIIRVNTVRSIEYFDCIKSSLTEVSGVFLVLRIKSSERRSSYVTTPALQSLHAA